MKTKNIYLSIYRFRPLLAAIGCSGVHQLCPHFVLFRSQIVAGISVFFICTSVISFCLKTLPAMRVEIPITTTIAPVSNHSGSINASDFYQASTTEMNFIPSTTQRPSGLFNRYSVNNFTWFYTPTLLWTLQSSLLCLACFWARFTLRNKFLAMKPWVVI